MSNTIASAMVIPTTPFRGKDTAKSEERSYDIIANVCIGCNTVFWTCEMMNKLL